VAGTSRSPAALVKRTVAPSATIIGTQSLEFTAQQTGDLRGDPLVAFQGAQRLAGADPQ